VTDLRKFWRWWTRPRDPVSDGLLATFLERREIEQSVDDALARALAPENEQHGVREIPAPTKAK
jgi:hypothetical protein